jgi:hypothetical protein
MNNSEMVVNATDRILRVFEIEETSPGKYNFEPRNKFFDSVDRTLWVDCGFSADEEYVIGGSTSTNSHDMYNFF